MDAGRIRVGGVGGDRSTDREQLEIGREIRAERHLDDVADAIRRQRSDSLNQVGSNADDVMRAGVSRDGFVRR